MADPGPLDPVALATDQRAVDAWLAAGASGDRAAWDARVSTLDASFASRSTLLFTNLAAVRPARLDARLTGVGSSLADARQAALGSGARVLQARLGWRLAGEPADASTTVWLTLVDGTDGTDGTDGVRVASTADGPALDSPPQPLWWLAPTTRADRGPATVLAGAGQDAERWAGLADGAAAEVREHLPSPLGRGWDGRVVVEVPGSESDFVRVLGGSPSAYAGTAAVTRPEGTTTDAPLRVVVNPAQPSGGTALATLLTHETVHVATRSAGSPAPLWAVEGLAELVALEAHPDQRTTELAALRSADGTSDPLPADDAFDAGGSGVTAAYARASLACRAVVDRRGSAALGLLYAALDRGEPLDRASTSTLGVDAETLGDWARDAQRRAAGGG